MNLAELKFSTEKRPPSRWKASPAEKMREAVINAIAIQRQLVQADKSGQAPNITKTVRRKSDDGTTTKATIAAKPRRWYWQSTATGKFVLEVSYSNHPIPLSGGKTVVECGSDLNAVDAVLQTIAAAVQSGALDKALTDVKAKRKIGTKKR